MTSELIDRRIAAARVGRLATIGPDGAADLVPITFAYEGEVLYTAVDQKPKTTRNLRRLANVRRDPRVTVLIDHYEDDWTRLWWCRLRGEAAVVGSGPVFDAGITLLRDKYAQYRGSPPDGPMIVVRVTDRRAWTA